MTILFSPDRSRSLLQVLEQSGHPLLYDAQKHSIRLQDAEGENLLQFRLPITMPGPAEAISDLDRPLGYVVLLIQAGNCAMGYFEGGITLDHKVYRAYMVRKKQGKSQLKYLKTKGKSRAGSRVRLGESEEFFENINERLQQYFEEYAVDRIALSCSKTLIPFLFNARVQPPFDKRDPRILKIPRHVHTPIYEVLLDVNAYLQKGELQYDEAQHPFVQQLLAKAEAQHR